MTRMAFLCLCLFLCPFAKANAGELGATSSQTVTITLTKVAGVVVNKTMGESCINAGENKIYAFLPPCAEASTTPDIIVNARDEDGVIMLFVRAV